MEDDLKPFADLIPYMVAVKITMPQFRIGCHRYRCNQCHEFFRRSKGSSKALFCGRSCAFAFQSQWHGKRRKPKAKKEPKDRKPRISEEERREKAREYSRNWYHSKVGAKRQKRETCIMCQSPIEGKNHGTKYCGYACNRKAEKKRNWEYYRVLSRIDRKRRTAASTGCEKFLSIEIFERDGWTCQICNKKVNRDLKVPNPMAPTLDHILPISAGGLHTRQNVRLAHLSCNCKRQHKGYAQGLLYG